jgi:hypothetical protein
MFQSMRAVRVASVARPTGLREWVREHDERWSFVVLYLGLAIGLSVFVSLFWLVVVAAFHFLLECGRQAHYRQSRTEVIGHALWEVKLDVGLVLLALTLVLYIDVVLGLLGLQSAVRAAAVTRAGARIGSRAAAWERNIRTFLLTVDEMARVVYAAVLVKKGEIGGGKGKAAVPEDVEGEPAAEPDVRPEPVAVVPEISLGWRGPWGIGDRIGVALVAAGIMLLIAAPFFTIHDWGSAATALLHELRPFPTS